MKTTTTPTAPTTRHATLRLLAALFFLCLFAPVAMGEGDTYWQDQQSEVADKLVNGNGGEGGKNDPILIASAEELAYFAKQVNSNAAIKYGSNGSINPKGSGFINYYFSLSSDIDLSKHYWTPIGNVDHPFYGNFDGGGHRVSGLKVKVEAEIEAYVGLFGKTSSGTIQNLGVCLAEEGIQVTTKTESGSAYAGGIAGQALSIRNCYVEGPKTRTGTAKVIAIAPQKGVCFAGGIVGSLLATSSIAHCYATVDVTAEGDYESYAGGIAGRSQGSIFYTYATGAVEATNGDNCAGGICGFAPQKSSLSNNLALNKSIKGDKGKSNRILGVGKAPLTSNFASTNIALIPSAGDILPTADGLNGADTWIETFHTDLIPDPDGTTNEWATAWEWPQADSGNLPKLKKVKGEEGSFTYGGVLTGQSDIDPNLSTAEVFPLILGVHIAAGVSVDLAYRDGKWLCNIQGSKDPFRPFNGTVKGADCPVILKPENSSDTPELIFDGVIWRNNETFLTISDGASLIMTVNNKVNINASATNPAIVNAGTLTIKAGNPNTLTVSSPSAAIKNTGTLILEGNGIYLVGGERTIEGEGTVSFNSPMVEWQFASALKGKVIKWEDVTFELDKSAHDLCQSMATTCVPINHSFGLTAGPADNLVTQQGHGGDNNYTTSFTAQDGQRTVFADVKPICFRIHLIQPAGGDLTVTYKDGSPLPNDNYVATGTQLTLLCTPEDNYILESYQSGPAADNLPDLQGNEVTVGESDLWLSARLRYERPTPPPPPAPVYYTVTLPQIEGATTDPGPDEYEVESWDSFRFYLTIDSAYSESQPIVTTDRGETLVPRTSDGAYLVKYVRTDVEIFIDGLIKNPPPVANEAISTDALVPQIWAEGSMLCIRMAEALPSAPVRIFTPDGRLHASFASTPGLNRRQLPTGIYIVRIGETACKVIIR